MHFDIQYDPLKPPFHEKQTLSEAATRDLPGGQLEHGYKVKAQVLPVLAGFTLLPTPLKPLPATFRPGPGLLHNTDPGDTPSPSRPGYQPPCPRDQQHRSSPHLEPQRWPSPLPEPTSPPRLPEAPSKFTPQPSLVSPRQQGRRGNIQLLKWSQAHAHVEDGTRGVRATSPGRGSGVEGGRCGPSTTSEGWALVLQRGLAPRSKGKARA